MADAATRFRIEAIVRGLENVEALKNSVKRLQSTASPAAADLNKLKGAAVALGSAADRTENDLRTAVAVLKDLRANVALNDAEFKRLTATIGRYEQQLNRANGTGGRFDKLGQTAGAVAASGVFGGPEGLLGAGIGALFGPAGALAGGAIGAQVGQVRVLIGETATYAAEISKLNIALKSVAGSQNEYLMAQMAINRAVADFNVPIKEATQTFTRLSASVIGAGGNVSDAEKVFRGVSAAIKATGGSAEDVQAALTAMAQVFGKGKVSAEELQGQLGERLPGAVTKFAQATGRTLPQLAKDLEQGTVGLNDLMKFVEALGREYEGTAKRIADSQDESGARMRVSLDRLRQAIGETFKPIGSALQDSIATLADKTVVAVGSIVGVFKDLKAAFDNISIGLPKVLTDIINQMPGFIARLVPIVGQLSFILEAAARLRGENPQSSGMFGRYGAPSSQTAIPQPTTQFQDPTGGKGDKDTKALERVEKERIRNAIELNRLEQDRIKSYFDQLRAGKDTLTQLQLERDELYYITRLKLQAAAIDKQSTAIYQASVVAINEQYKASIAKIDAQRQETLDAIKKIDLESKRITTDLAAGALIKTPLEQAYERINDQIQKAIESQDKLLKDLQELGGSNPEAQAIRANIERRRAQLVGTPDTEKIAQASELLTRGDREALEQQIAQLQKMGVELSTLDQLVLKYGADWERLSGVQREYLTSLAEQKDRLQEIFNVVTTLGQAIQSSLSTAISSAVTSFITGAQSIKQTLAELFRSVGEAFIKMAADIIAKQLVIVALNQLAGIFGGAIGGGGGGLGGLFGSGSPAAIAGGGIFSGAGPFAFANGGVMSANGVVPLKRYAGGGVANSPQMAVFGERGPEAYVPLPDGRSIPVKMKQRSEALNRYRPIGGTGTMAGGTDAELGSAVSPMGGGSIDVRYSVERINNVDYVTAEQFQQGLQKAAAEGAQRGEQRTLRRLQQSPTTRRRLGV